MTVQILTGDCRHVMRKMEAQSVQCVVCSPPYWGLRDYKIAPSVWGGELSCKHVFAETRTVRELRKGEGMARLGKRYRGGGHKTSAPAHIVVEQGFCIHCGAWRGCFGLEPTYQLYIEHLVEIFDEVWRVLRDDGTLWLNLGDSYATGAGKVGQHPGGGEQGARWAGLDRQHGGIAPTCNGRTVDWGFRSRSIAGGAHKGRGAPARADGSEDNSERPNYGPMTQPNRMPQAGLKAKDMCGIPWRAALALQDAGWYLRRDIIWFKPNPMPESVYDRPTTSHEYLFLFSKSGNTLLWRHEDGRWVTEKPAPEFYWRNRETREEAKQDPGEKGWIKCNRWRGFDYYYDYAAIMEPSSPDSHARAARSRSTNHKWANGGPNAANGAPQSIAIGSPVAGRLLPAPAGGDNGEGHHGSVHRNGRRPQDARWKPGGPNSRFAKDQVPTSRKSHAGYDGPRPKNNANWDLHLATADIVAMRNKRSVWKVASKPFKDAHFATFPPALIVPCILAGAPKGGIVLDPFGGAGTTGLVAQQNGRSAILIELNKNYAAMAQARIAAALMGPEEKARHTIKRSGKLQTIKGLPLFKKKRKPVTRDGAAEAPGEPAP